MNKYSDKEKKNIYIYVDVLYDENCSASGREITSNLFPESGVCASHGYSFIYEILFGFLPGDAMVRGHGFTGA